MNRGISKSSPLKIKMKVSCLASSNLASLCPHIIFRGKSTTICIQRTKLHSGEESIQSVIKCGTKHANVLPRVIHPPTLTSIPTLPTPFFDDDYFNATHTPYSPLPRDPHFPRMVISTEEHTHCGDNRRGPDIAFHIIHECNSKRYWRILEKYSSYIAWNYYYASQYTTFMVI